MTKTAGSISMLDMQEYERQQMARLAKERRGTERRLVDITFAAGLVQKAPIVRPDDDDVVSLADDVQPVSED